MLNLFQESCLARIKLVKAYRSRDQENYNSVHLDRVVHRNNLLSSWRWENSALNYTLGSIVLNIDRVVLTEGHSERNFRLFSVLFTEITLSYLNKWNFRRQIVLTQDIESTNQHFFFHSNSKLLWSRKQLAVSQNIRKLKLIHHLESL